MILDRLKANALLIVCGVLLLGVVGSGIYASTQHAKAESLSRDLAAVTAERDAQSSGWASCKAANSTLQEEVSRERAKEPEVREVIREVYRTREVRVPAAPVVAKPTERPVQPSSPVDAASPYDRALDGVRKLRASFSPVP